jgi:hypothetical protein
MHCACVRYDVRSGIFSPLSFLQNFLIRSIKVYNSSNASFLVMSSHLVHLQFKQIRVHYKIFLEVINIYITLQLCKTVNIVH